jgi:hypothetical protein
MTDTKLTTVTSASCHARSARGMSALGQKPKSCRPEVMSASAPTADIARLLERLALRDVNSLAASIANEEFNGDGAVVSYLGTKETNP